MSVTETPDTFTVRGRAAPYGDVAIVWTDGAGFDDPTGRTKTMIDAGDKVAVTATGPYFDAADKPGAVALLTASSALDEVSSIDGGDVFNAELDALGKTPDGATP